MMVRHPPPCSTPPSGRAVFHMDLAFRRGQHRRYLLPATRVRQEVLHPRDKSGLDDDNSGPCRLLSAIEQKSYRYAREGIPVPIAPSTRQLLPHCTAGIAPGVLALDLLSLGSQAFRFGPQFASEDPMKKRTYGPQTSGSLSGFCEDPE